MHTPILPLSFRWITRSLICPLSDITLCSYSLQDIKGKQDVGTTAGLWKVNQLSMEVQTKNNLASSVRDMQAIIAEEDASMEELDDHNLQMEETAQGLLRTPSLKESYHSDTDFMTGKD